MDVATAPALPANTALPGPARDTADLRIALFSGNYNMTFDGELGAQPAGRLPARPGRRADLFAD